MNWQEQLRGALRTSKALGDFLGRPVAEVAYPLMIPLPLAERIRSGGPSSPLWRQFVPHPDESNENGMSDPIGDHRHAVGGALIHRYRNRALFLSTRPLPGMVPLLFSQK